MGSSPNRLVGIVLGAVFVVVGILGFFAAPDGLLFSFFLVNPLQNALHVLIGSALAIAALSSVAAARRVNSIVGTVLLVLGIVGLFLAGSSVNVLALNAADNVLHLAAAALLLAVGLGADKRAA